MPDPAEVNSSSGKSRVFFALWPDADVMARLGQETRRLHRLLGGKPTRPDSLHLTLVFVGEVENGRLGELAAAAERVECPGFELDFDREACWRHNRIANLGISRPPPSLFELVGQLSSRLTAAGMAFDARRFLPHVTLIRKADCSLHARAEMENPALEPIRWSARDFVLVRSSPRPEGARYEQLGSWPLR